MAREPEWIGVWDRLRMIVTLKSQGLQTMGQIRPLRESTQNLDFDAPAQETVYDWIAGELRRFRYTRLRKAEKGLVRRYLEKVTGLPRALVTRLVQQVRDTGSIRDRHGAPAKRFPRRYTQADIRLLAEVDASYGTLSGPVTRKLCKCAYTVIGDECFERLATLSNDHLHNLRGLRTYQRLRGASDKTRPVRVKIDERRKLHPGGRRLLACRFGP